MAGRRKQREKHPKAIIELAPLDVARLMIGLPEKKRPPVRIVLPVPQDGKCDD